MHSELRGSRRSLLLIPLGLAALAGCQDGALSTGLAAEGPTFNLVAPPTCEGVQLQMTRLTGPEPVTAGQTGAWTVGVEITACQAVTDVSAQGGTVAWATTSYSASAGTIAVRKANKQNDVLLWTIGAMAAGDVARATLTIVGTIDRKAVCESLVSIVSDWSATANAGAGPIKFGAAGPVTVGVCTSAPPPPPPPPVLVAPAAVNDEYSLVAGATLNIAADAGLLANDALGSPVATISAVLGGDGEPLGTRTILDGAVAIDAATGAITLTGATRAGTETFQYEITNTEGMSRGVITITVTPGAATSMLAYLGDGQTAAVGETVAVAPAVRVTDAYGNAISAADVTFAVTGGGGSATGTSATTTGEGIAGVGSWTLGAAGENTLQASSGLLSVNFTATAVASCTAGTPATAVFSAISSAVPTNTLLTAFRRDVTLLVTDDCGTPLPGIDVTWSASGTSSLNLSGTQTTTGADGTATADWRTTLCGIQSVSATVAGLPTATYTVFFGTCFGSGRGGAFQ